MNYEPFSVHVQFDNLSKNPRKSENVTYCFIFISKQFTPSSIFNSITIKWLAQFSQLLTMVTLDAVTCQANILQVKRPILVDMVLYVEVDFINTSSQWLY